MNNFNPQRICFMFAMHAEAAPLIEKYSLEEVADFFAPLPPKLFKGSHNGKEIFAVLNVQQNGLDIVGIVPDTLPTKLVIILINHSLLSMAGTC